MNIEYEKLKSYTAKELLNLLDKSFIARALAKKDSKLTRKDIGKIQEEIVKTIWIKYPEIAKEQGFKKLKGIK